jgi:hypothetical protein
MVSMTSCTGKKIVSGIQDGKLVCVDRAVPGTCPKGLFVTGISADGGITCASPTERIILIMIRENLIIEIGRVKSSLLVKKCLK